LEDKDKTIEVIKAAMEMEEKAKNSENSMDEKIDESTCIDETIGEKAKSSKSLLKGSKNKELAAKEEKILELNDRLMRSMAEFDNFRKRSEKEKSQMYDLGVKSIIEKMLPIIDNFERGLDSVKETDKDNPLVQGFNMIYKQLMTTMEEIGVKVIEAVGNEFDPNFHNAVMHGEDEELGENIVSEEYQKGYMYHDTVVRHSMVKVVN
jgi:molecular chaperone GrpE